MLKQKKKITPERTANELAAGEYLNMLRERVNMFAIDLITHRQKRLKIIEAIPPNEIPTATRKAATRCLETSKDKPDTFVIHSMRYLYNAWSNNNYVCMGRLFPPI